jgi:DNA-binding IclR family transcriptional regulator
MLNERERSYMVSSEELEKGVCLCSIPVLSLATEETTKISVRTVSFFLEF